VPTFIISISGILLTVVLQVIYLFYRLGQVSVKIDTVWSFLIRRAEVEIVNKGWGKLNSPLEIDINAIEMIEPLVRDIIPFYREILIRRPNISDLDLFIEIEKKFGDSIVKSICVPHKLELGGCLLLIIMACKQFSGNSGKEHS